jgi:hypothetical protein
LCTDNKDSISISNTGKLKKLILTGLGLALIFAIQFISLPNIITGIAVNAIFIFYINYVGLRYATFIGFLSPLGGTLSGHLASFLYPLIPVIVIGNSAYIFAYHFLAKSKLAIRMFVPAIIKAVLIGGIGWIVVKQLDVPEKFKWVVFAVLGIQFLTASLGALLGEKLTEQIASKPQSAEELSS